MIGRPPTTYEVLGGPADGESQELEAGENVWRLRIGGVWHTYRVQPTDVGLMLVHIRAILP